MIHGSFAGISSTHTRTIMHKLSLYSFLLRCHVNSTSGTSPATKTTTPFECQQQERRRERSTRCLQSVSAGGSAFKGLCLYPDIMPPHMHSSRQRRQTPLIVLALFTSTSLWLCELTKQVFVDERSFSSSYKGKHQSSWCHKAEWEKGRQVKIVSKR